MFGYIKPHIPDLRVYQHEIYKSAYCGLCKTAGKQVSFFARFFLSYDFAFMAILRLYLTDEKYVVSKRRCDFKPYKKHNEMQQNEALNFCACAFSIFTYYKIEDNYRDAFGFKKFLFKLLLIVVKSFKLKPQKRYPKLCQNIEEPLLKLWEEEKNDNSTIDSLSNLFGTLAKNVISDEIPAENKVIAEEVGFQIGRFIYIIDALDDLEKDQKENNFNPFINEFKTPENALNYAKENFDLLMFGLYSGAEKLKTINENSPLYYISDNILACGCNMTLKKVVFKNENTKISH